MCRQKTYILCKVWGLAKYRHPSITDGTINWDAELFRVMPLVLDATDTKQSTNIIFEWINQFSFTIPELDAETTQLKDDYDAQKKILVADLSWINDTEVLGEDLSEYLVRLSEVVVTNQSNGYAAFSEENIYVNMNNEDPYTNMKFDDTGMRFLGLFRYWNIIEYFFPYKDIMDEDWNEVLIEMIPQFIGEEHGESWIYKESYALSLAQLSAYIQDSHATVTIKKSNVPVLMASYLLGSRMPPLEFENIDGQIVISKVGVYEGDIPQNLELGDIVLSIDGVDIEERIELCKKYISLSSDDKLVYGLSRLLLSSHEDTAVIEVLRNNEILSLTVQCHTYKTPLSGNEPSELIENEQIGYINTSQLKSGDIDNLMTQFKDTKGLVVDLRNYPSDPYMNIDEYLIADSTPFAKFGMCNPFVPGEFIESPTLLHSGQGSYGSSSDKALYENKVVILMDEASISRAETNIMSLRSAPNVVVLGSPSIGANGDVLSFMLPGGISTTFSGLSFFYPDGTQTQRVGLEPDIYLKPTVNGLKEGRDELLEEAVSIILGE